MSRIPISIRSLLPLLAWFVAACGTDSATTAPDVRVDEPALAVASGVCNYDRDDVVLANEGWATAFDEDFAASLGRWRVWTGGAFNNELQHYQASNLQLSGGQLAIAARRETVTGATTPFDPTSKTFTYTSGRIESSTHFSANRTTPNVRMAARLKLPAGYGLWPAFWSYGDPWPTQGEIDILEARGQNAFEYNTAYWYGRRAGVNQVGNSAVTIQTQTSLTDCWHVYEVIWTRDALTFLFDGQIVDVKTGGQIPNMFRKQQRVTLNLAVGGSFFPTLDVTQIQTGTLLADWVRVYTR